MSAVAPLAAPLETLALTQRERLFLRALLKDTVIDLVTVLRQVEPQAAPDLHRKFSESLECAVGLLAQLPRAETKADKT